MQSRKSRFTKTELIAFAVGILVVVVVSLITTRIRPIPFPFNFVISLVLGTIAAFGSLKIIDPWTEEDRVQQAANTEFSQKLVEIKAITERIWEISQSPHVDSETSHLLSRIASMVGLLTTRYRERSRDLAATSNLLTVLQVFEPSLTTYFKIKSGEQFLEQSKREAELDRTQRDILPMLERALETWGERLDSGEVVSKRVSEGTLESMLRSLDLIKALNNQLDHPSLREGAVDDQQ